MEQQLILEDSPSLEALAMEAAALDSEPVAVLEQISPIDMAPVVAEPPAAEKIHHYDHGDGRVFEGTVAEARRVCTALARMTMQEASNTLEQSERDARLAARGRERRLAEEAAQQQMVIEQAAAKTVKPVTEKAQKPDTHESVAEKPASKSAQEESIVADDPVEVVRRLENLSDKPPVAQRTVVMPAAKVSTAPKEPKVTISPASPADKLYPVIDTVVQRVLVDTRQRQESAAVHVVEQLEVAVPAWQVEPALPRVVAPKAITAVPRRVESVRQVPAAAEPVRPALRPVEVAPATVPEIIAETSAQPEAVEKAVDEIVVLQPESTFVASMSYEQESAPPMSPEVVCAEFTEALQVLFVPPAESLAPMTLERDLPITHEATAPEAAPLPAIVTKVAERLPELTPPEQEAAAPILSEIVSILSQVRHLENIPHLIRPSEGKADEIRLPEADEARLELLVVELLETLRIDFTQEDVHDFMQVLLGPDFQVAHLEKTAELDLENEGMHEVKRRFTRLAASLADVEELMQQLLGSFALFHATRDRYELAA